MSNGYIFIALSCFIGLLMTWSVGANDLANIMSTSIGSKAITPRQAIIIAIIFEFAGAFLGGHEVMNTLSNGIINSQLIAEPEVLVYGMLAALMAGTSWMLSASYLGLPVSITNSIVGAIVGFGCMVLGVKAIHWEQVSHIAISWLASPSLAALAAYMLFMSMQWLIFRKAEPYLRARRYAPIYLFLVGIVLALMTVIKGLEHCQVILSSWAYITITMVVAIAVVISGMLLIIRIRLVEGAEQRVQFLFIEKIFAVLMAFTACAMVFAHGSNDVAIAVGPMAAVITIAKAGAVTKGMDMLPYWIIAFGCMGVILGLLMYGRKVIATVGKGITNLNPSRAFAATLAGASTVIVSTSIGIPVSATQTLVGAIMGVGLARGIGSLNLNIIRNIFMSWIITLPVSAGLTILFFYGLKAIFS